MLDPDIFAYTIAIVRDKTTITAMQLGNDLGISQYKADQILKELVVVGFVEEFEGFYCRCDLVAYN